MTNQNKAYFYAFLSVFLWSTVATAFKIALENQNFINLLFYSTSSSLFILFIIFFYQRRKLNFDRESIINSLIMGLLNPFLYYLVLFKAYSLLPAQTALTLNYSWAIVIVIFSIVFLKQKVSIINFIGLFISFFGVIFIATKGNIFNIQLVNSFGVILASGSSLIWGTYWIINLKDRRESIEKLLLNFIFGFFYILIYILIFDKIQFVNLKTTLANIYIGFFEMGITFYFWMNALKLSKNTSTISNIIYLSPFISLIFISIMLNENIESYSYLGLTFIILGIILPKFVKAQNN